MPDSVAIFWFRRDLRLHDNAGLYYALRSGHAVLPVFIFDTNILDGLEEKKDRRVQFIHDSIVSLKGNLEKLGATLLVLHASPVDCFKKLIGQFEVKAVYTNHDYEPYARDRDSEIAALLKANDIAFNTFKDQVIFDRSEVLKDNGSPYTVFTPYSTKWKEKLNAFYLMPYPTEKYFQNFCPHPPVETPTLHALGFDNTDQVQHPPALNAHIASGYDKTRDFPAINGTTRLSVHLRFGTISIRQLAASAKALNATLLNELIWREFYQAILWHFPHVVSHAFKKEYDKIVWRNNETEFECWCLGKTGYPIVDAGMRELNETGYMHNRVRMITAGFLTRHLLIDWRWGEAYFATKLLDYDLAANNGGWQWAAGSGCDAAPYFRIFNPSLQAQKFDPDLKYIRKWVPEYDQLNYPQPIVEHRTARDRCLKAYKTALNR